ncbi:MAG TPA: hypothetical protein VGX25_17810 [Actinophytocola sp.]|uniref:hypothetical protein n=1 Tax=Actinophytocola sp. TaxID=1872138 RepID=UPI002DDD4A5F|nr:hypothetical protein [Actinophytocola sp.]HEV2781241.1 hypothetical protein [Actinophytocola sp.]
MERHSAKQYGNTGVGGQRTEPRPRRDRETLEVRVAWMASPAVIGASRMIHLCHSGSLTSVATMGSTLSTTVIDAPVCRMTSAAPMVSRAISPKWSTVPA